MLLVVMLYVFLHVYISYPPISSSRSPLSLLTIDIPSDVIEEFEKRHNRERIMWRERVREAWDSRLAEERVARGNVGGTIQS